MATESTSGASSQRARPAAALVLALLVAAVAWDAPRTLGEEAGLTACALLAASGGTLTALLVGGPRLRSIVAGLVSLTLVAVTCAVSAAHTSPV